MRRLTELEKLLFHKILVERRLSSYLYKIHGNISPAAEEHSIIARELRRVVRDADLNNEFVNWCGGQNKMYKDCSITELLQKLSYRADNKSIFVIGPFINNASIWNVESSYKLPAGSMVIGIRMDTLDLNEEERESVRIATALLEYDPAVVKMVDHCTRKGTCFGEGHYIPKGSVLLHVNPA